MRRVLVPLHVPAVAPLTRRAAGIVSLGGETMGTTWSVKLVAANADAGDAILRIVQAELARVIAQMSQWEPQSDISRFNRAAAGSWHQLPDEFFYVLRTALALAHETGGAYDPTIGALSEIWGFGVAAGRKDHAPEAAAIDRAREACGWQAVALDAERSAALQPGGVSLDLSSIAKGFAVDLVAQALVRHGCNDHLVEIGGELRGTGTKPDGSPWWVALEETQGAAFETIVALHGLSIATSGDSRRYIEAGGRKLSHTIDPRSGWPIRDTLASVTVLHASCMHADALATALSVLGAEEGYSFAASRDLAARFVMRGVDGPRERITPAFEAMLD